MLPKYRLFLSNALEVYSNPGQKDRNMTLVKVISFIARVTLDKIHPEIVSM